MRSIYYLPQGWDPVLERDIDGERAATTELDRPSPVRRDARLPPSGTHGVPWQRADAGTGRGQAPSGHRARTLMLGCAQPGQVLGHYKDGVRALVDRLQYLNSANNRFWFDTRPNLRREMEDRKRRFHDKEDVFP